MTPLLQAEQAVLGAALLEPRGLDQLAGWLRPEHFYRPAHSALFAAMLTLRAHGHPATTAPAGASVPLSWPNEVGEKAATWASGITPDYVHSLMSACPRAENAPVYGRMVLEGAIHRDVTEHAIRLHQAARADAARNTGVTETLRHTQILNDALDDLARRWGTEPRSTQPHPSPEPAPTAPFPVNDQALADEEFLLRVLTTHPGQLADVAHWLSPGDFADPGHQQIYRALGALHHRREPVDELTVLWECQRRGALADDALAPDRVRRICQAPFPGSADYFGVRLLDSSLLRAAAASAAHVRELAGDDSLAPGQLISQARRALAPLDQARRRRAAADSVPVPQQEATTTPRNTPLPRRATAARARSPAPRAASTASPTRPTPAATTPSHRPRRSSP